MLLLLLPHFFVLHFVGTTFCCLVFCCMLCGTVFFCSACCSMLHRITFCFHSVMHWVQMCFAVMCVAVMCFAVMCVAVMCFAVMCFAVHWFRPCLISLWNSTLLCYILFHVGWYYVWVCRWNSTLRVGGEYFCCTLCCCCTLDGIVLYCALVCWAGLCFVVHGLLHFRWDLI